MLPLTSRSILRPVSWLNGLGALALICISSALEEMHVRPALFSFLIGLTLCGFSSTLALASDMVEFSSSGGVRQYYRIAIVLFLLLTHLAGFASFVMGCLMFMTSSRSAATVRLPNFFLEEPFP